MTQREARDGDLFKKNTIPLDNLSLNSLPNVRLTVIIRTLSHITSLIIYINMEYHASL